VPRADFDEILAPVVVDELGHPREGTGHHVPPDPVETLLAIGAEYPLEVLAPLRREVEFDGDDPAVAQGQLPIGRPPPSGPEIAILSLVPAVGPDLPLGPQRASDRRGRELLDEVHEGYGVPDLAFHKACRPQAYLPHIRSGLGDPNDPRGSMKVGPVSMDQAQVLQDFESSVGCTLAGCGCKESFRDLVSRHHAVLADPSQDLPVSGGDLVTGGGFHVQANDTGRRLVRNEGVARLVGAERSRWEEEEGARGLRGWGDNTSS